MTSRRISGGLHDFVDEHNEYGQLSKEEEERLERAKERARRRKYLEEHPELRKQIEKQEFLDQKAKIKGIPRYWIEEAPNRANEQPRQPKSHISLWQKIKKKLGL